MKQKNIIIDIPVTKKDFVKELSKHTTHTDLGDMEVRIDENARCYRDEVLTEMDQVIGELAQIREDRLFEKQTYPIRQY